MPANENSTIKSENDNKSVAIKILRPNIEKLFNEELDALMLFAYLIENTISKAKRLKLVEVVHLLREITNIEMDLRFEGKIRLPAPVRLRVQRMRNLEHVR